jgi:hypothetical protein
MRMGCAELLEARSNVSQFSAGIQLLAAAVESRQLAQVLQRKGSIMLSEGESAASCRSHFFQQADELEAQASALQSEAEQLELAAEHEAAQAACKSMNAKLVGAQALRRKGDIAQVCHAYWCYIFRHDHGLKSQSASKKSSIVGFISPNILRIRDAQEVEVLKH